MRGIRQMLWIGAGLSACAFVVVAGLWVAGLMRREPPDQVAVTRPYEAPAALHTAPPSTDEPVAEAVSLSAIRLLRTWVRDDPRDSLALLQDVERNKRAFVHLGDRLGPWELTAIEPDGVVLRTAAGEEWRLAIEAAEAEQGRLVQQRQGGSGFSGAIDLFRKALSTSSPEQVAKAAEAITVVSDTERLVNRQQLFEAVESPLQFLSQSRMMPHLDGLKLDGMRVTWLADSPWTQKVGFEVGDVITKVNGKPVLDPRNFTEILSDVSTAPALNLTIRRGGQDVTLAYKMQSAIPAPVMGGNP